MKQEERKKGENAALKTGPPKIPKASIKLYIILDCLQASRDVKDILVQCWYFEADQRPNFFGLLEILNKLPKKRLARSPSHPIHLSRSAESVF